MTSDNIVCRSYIALTLQELLQKIPTTSTTSSGIGAIRKIYDGQEYLGVFWHLDIQADTSALLWRAYLYYYDENLPQDYD